MADRLNQLKNQITNAFQASRSNLLDKHPDDVVIVCALRTAITRAGKGGFKDSFPEDMLAGVLQGVVKTSGINPALIEDIAVGTVLTPSGGASVARAASLIAGIPNTAGLNTVNRQCSSGLMAVVQIAHEIQSGMIDIGIGGGMESMTKHFGPGALGEVSDAVHEHHEAKDVLIPMGITSENVAKKYNISRRAQDEFAASSYQKAEQAQKKGYFDAEIYPLTVKYTDPKTGNESSITVSKDDGIRAGTTVEVLSKLKPAFSKDGTTHAGNASQVSDGAAAVLLARRSVAEKHGLPIQGKFVSGTVVGVPPAIMGVGPAYAIPKLLTKAGLTIDDIDIFEINEAFASQCLYSAQALKIPMDKLNPKGGAIAFGHPLGVSGARQIATLLTELKRTGKKVGVTSMCVGSGMGMAGLFVAEY